MLIGQFSQVIGLHLSLALLGPYLLWASFATFLTYTILRLNSKVGQGGVCVCVWRPEVG